MASGSRVLDTRASAGHSSRKGGPGTWWEVLEGPGCGRQMKSGEAGPHSQQQPLGSPLQKKSRCAPPQVRGGGGSGGHRPACGSGSRRCHHDPLPGQPGTPEGKAGVSVHRPPPRPGLAAPRAAGVAGLSLPAPRTPSAQLPSTPPAPAPPLGPRVSLRGLLPSLPGSLSLPGPVSAPLARVDSFPAPRTAAQPVHHLCPVNSH